MSDRATHEARAVHNEDLFAHLRASAPTRFCDWEAVGLFYAAVHLVDALFSASYGLHPANHYESDPSKQPGRSQLVQQHLRAAYGDYRHLYNLSREARYDPHIQITPVRIQHAHTRFRNLKSEVAMKLPP